MKAMLLAAGRGERLRPLTDHTPKPLLEVGDRPLIEWQIERLVAAGLRDLVINLGHLGECIAARLGDGRRLGVNIAYSPEPPGALETGGGIRRALPLLGDAPFLVVNADVWIEYDFTRLPALTDDLAHLVLVPNPSHNARGDFALDGARVRNEGEPRHTFAGVALYSPTLFTAHAEGRFPLAPLLRAATAECRVSGELHRGIWIDVGTPARLADAVQRAASLTNRRGMD